MPKFTRNNPSPRYREMEALYKEMHQSGDVTNAIAPEETFDGRSLLPHIKAIGNCIKATQSKTLLDYGCGKAGAYEHASLKLPNGESIKGLKSIWGLEEIRLYDPGFAPYQEYPTAKYDAVISTDVLEHITKEDMDWVIEEILGFAKKFVFLNVACYPAKKVLPNGENAHITLETPGWWLDLVHEAKRSRFDDLKVYMIVYDQKLRQIFVEL